MKLKLKKQEAGTYVTEDGRYEVSKGIAYTYCDGPHPIRLSRAFRDAVRYGTDEEKRREQVHLYPAEAVWAVQNGKTAYYCEGGEEHPYDSWGVTDLTTDDYVDGGEDFRTKKEAIGWLEFRLAREERAGLPVGAPGGAGI